MQIIRKIRLMWEMGFFPPLVKKKKVEFIESIQSEQVWNQDLAEPKIHFSVKWSGNTETLLIPVDFF